MPIKIFYILLVISLFNIVSPNMAADLVPQSIYTQNQQIRVYQSYILGSFYKFNGQYDNALQEFMRGLSWDSTNVEITMEVAELYYLQDDFDKATTYSKKVLAIQKDNPTARLLLGTIYARLNKHTLAINEILQSLMNDSTQDAAESLLAEEYWRTGNIKSSIDHYEKAISLNPADIISIFQLGTLYSLTSDYEKAVECFKTVTKLNPNIPMGYISLANCYEMLNQSYLAETAYLKAISLDSTSIPAYTGLSEIYISQMNYSSVTTYLRYLITKQPDYNSHKLRYGIALVHLGQYEEAQSYLEPLVNKKDNSPLAKLYLGFIYHHNGNKTGAANFIKDSIIQASDEKNILKLYSNYFSETHQVPQSIDYLEKIYQQYPQYSSIAFSLALSYESLNKPDIAMSWYQTAYKKNKNNPEIPYHMGIISLENKKYEEAIGYLKESVTLSPDEPDYLNALGYVYVENNINFEEALKLLIKAVSLSPEKYYILDSLGWCYFKRGDYEKAVEYLEKSYKINPNNSEMILHLAQAYYRNNNLEKAISLLEKRLSDDKGNKQIKNLLREYKQKLLLK